MSLQWIKMKKNQVNQNQASQSEEKWWESMISKNLKMGFTWNEDEEDSRPHCIICYEQLAHESTRPNKLRRHIETTLVSIPSWKTNPSIF